MVKDKDSNIIVSEGSFARKRLKCNDQWIEILSGGESETRGYVIEYAYFGKGQPVFIDLTKSFFEFVDSFHDLESLELKCLPSEDKIGVYVPSLDESGALYLMIMKDGRIINGYNLSGHDASSE